jgi:catechol 2,3-dioxygenase-like lactoylglutathione lyase family enzyme
MSRVQLAINVTDVGAAVAFYSKLFGVEPAKQRPGYANFAIADPPLKLVLIENDGTPGSLNHLGVEVEGPADVKTAIDKFVAQDVSTDVEEGVTCCYALQDKVWVTDPDGARWEVYTVLADADRMAPEITVDGEGACSCQSPASGESGTVPEPAAASAPCC